MNLVEVADFQKENSFCFPDHLVLFKSINIQYFIE
ncbi:hypothetical protein P23_1719 [Acinetobacter calcoaceticus]|nr:hypothetical protein P23_1719 [Acinetobacter calcoaceticus]